LQRAIVRDVLNRAALTGPDQNLPARVKVRHGRNSRGKLLHYYLNFSGAAQTVAYPYRLGSDLITNHKVANGQQLTLKPWDLAIVVEQ
jgi:beta-galactosidase